MMQINFDAKQYIGKREEQQDSFVSIILDADNGFQLHVLADGMGGHNAGSVASKVVCQSFVKYFEIHSLQSPEQDLKAALTYANSSIAQLLQQKPELTGMGTTVIAVIYNERSNQYSYISVGDSPMYVFNQGLLQRVNANHSYYEKLLKMVEAGVISQQDADSDPQRHSITSAIMGDKIPEIDVNTRLLKENDILIMASDGLQTLDDSTHGEIAQIAHQYGYDPETLARELLQAVEQRNYEYQDNTSIIVIKSSISSAKNYSLPKTPPLTQNQPSISTKKKKSSSKMMWFITPIILILLFVITSFFMLKAQYNQALSNKNGTEKETLYFKWGLYKWFAYQKTSNSEPKIEQTTSAKPANQSSGIVPSNNEISSSSQTDNAKPSESTIITPAESNKQSKMDDKTKPSENSTNSHVKPQTSSKPDSKVSPCLFDDCDKKLTHSNNTNPKNLDSALNGPQGNHQQQKN